MVGSSATDLHWVGDNRQSGIGVAQRFVPKGFDVLAYDGRAHRASDGDNCTYGFHEKNDVSRALDAVGAKTAILIGSSMGAAIALQAAAVDPRISAVVAQSPFSDLPTISSSGRRSSRAGAALLRPSLARSKLRVSG